MGMIRISVEGSFSGGPQKRQISALRHGHAQAVQQAIAFLVNDILPAAITRDHELQAQGEAPPGDDKFRRFKPDEPLA